jgi:hypothetical protein
LNPLIARFRAAAVAAGQSLNCGGGRLDREFGVFAVCRFLHIVRGGPVNQSPFPTAAAYDLVAVLRSGWNGSAIEQCLQSHFG